MGTDEGLLAPLAGTEHEVFAGIEVDAVSIGRGRVKRLIYQPGTRWSVDVKPLIGTEYCMHAHVGFLAKGHLRGEYADGCAFDFRAPFMVVIEPGHDAWVVGDEPAVLIQFDFAAGTVDTLGIPPEHRHD